MRPLLPATRRRDQRCTRVAAQLRADAASIDRVRLSLANQQQRRAVLAGSHRSMPVALPFGPLKVSLPDLFSVCFQALGIRAAKQARSWHSACDKKH
jgi:hypothetical protein